MTPDKDAHISRSRPPDESAPDEEGAVAPESLLEEELPPERQWSEAFLSAVNIFKLYQPAHPKSKETLEAFCEATAEFHEELEDEISLLCIGETTRVANAVMDPKIVVFKRIAEEFRLRNIHELVFAPGIPAEELTAFMTLFCEPPTLLAERGGMELVLEEAGFAHVRLGHLKYAVRSEMGTVQTGDDDEALDDDRVLFARMEECLNYEYDAASPDSRDPSDQLIDCLKNVQGVARFLETKAEGESDDEEAESAMIAILKQMATIVHSRRPEQWERTKKKLADALVAMMPRVREAVLGDLNKEKSIFLDEIVSEFEPDQIALILADHLSTIIDAPASAKESKSSSKSDTLKPFIPERGGDEKPAASKTGEASPLIQQLIQSPEHFELLQPLLMSEFTQRGMRHEDCGALFGPVLGKYFPSAQSGPLAAIHSDKSAIYRFAGQASEEQLRGIEPLLDTFEEAQIEESLQNIRLEILDMEEDPQVYSEILGIPIVESIPPLFGLGDAEGVRGRLDGMLDHAAGVGEELFEGRQETARGLLKEIEPFILLDSFLPPDADKEETGRNLDRLLSSHIDGVALGLVQRTFAENAAPGFPELMEPLMVREAGYLAPQIKEWLRTENEKSPHFKDTSTLLWRVLDKGLCEECLPVFEILIRQDRAKIGKKTIQMLSRMGGDGAEALLAARVELGRKMGKLAEKELCRLTSPHAVPLLDRRLKKLAFLSSHYAGKMEAVNLLGHINSPESRLVLIGFMTARRNKKCSAQHRELIMRALGIVRSWPEEDARDVLNYLLEHKDKHIAMTARIRLGRLGKSDKTEEAP